MNNELVEMQKTLTEKVGRRVSQMEQEGLALPKNYNYQNALKSAFFELDKVRGIERCTQASIANALLNMITQGLSPAKTQCYFIAYGNELQMQRSYFGTVAALKRLEDVEKISAEVIHEGDVFEIGANAEMETIVKTFEPKFENQDKPLIGAFAMIKKTDGTVSFTIMTKKEIDQSWRQSRNKANAVQQNFSQEMAKRTVLNRAAKMFINTSDDSDLLSGAINQTTENEYDDDRNERKDVTPKDEQAKNLFTQALEQPQKAPQEQKEEPKVITPKPKEKMTHKATATKKEEPKQVEAVEVKETAVAKEEKASDEKVDDLAKVIDEVNNEEPDENQTALFDHWGEPTNEE
ncbi:recombinase RecT [Ligilactobacillus animalis]|uniref:recombinase RecT n=1 Tax=Ligilactobacillus animalis TaxID=1605 RepID=UPI0026DF865B|nr:RecT family recombinase [Ligilactobacillus animalis]MDO5883885.1 RecT family recombinase [Ligilactobacillus animalis]